MSRRERVADAAIEVLAREGARGLTHRAVDAEAGLSEGATSNVFRTRAALLDGAQARLVERELASTERRAPEGGRAADPATVVTAFVLDAGSTARRSLTLARLELYLEAARSPALRASVDGFRTGYLEMVIALLRTTWPDADEASLRRRATEVVAVSDGITLNRVLHPASPMSDDGVRAAIARAVEQEP